MGNKNQTANLVFNIYKVGYKLSHVGSVTYYKQTVALWLCLLCLALCAIKKYANKLFLFLNLGIKIF